jgi:hypothetical protein
MQPPYSPYGQQAPYAQQQPFNPYAPPGPAMYRQNLFVPYGASAGPLVGPTLRKVKLALGIVQIIAMLAAVGLFVGAGAMGNEDGAPLAIAGMAALALWYLLLFGYGIVSVVWLYRFWSWVPPEQRHTSMWKKYISPGMAIGFMFIPYFNLYWMFVIYLGLADIMERMRVRYPCSKAPAKTLAIMTIVIPMVFFPAGPFLHYVLAKHLEDMANEMQSRMAGGIPTAPAV